MNIDKKKKGIIFIQLSDFHTQVKNHIIDNSMLKIVDLLKSIYEVSESYVCFCFTGDIAFSGKKEEYEIFSEYIVNLKETIKKEKIENVDFLFVPGNHDIDFYNNERTREQIIEYKKRLNFEKINDELKRFQNFYDFSEKFETKKLTNKQVDSFVVQYNRKKILINRINTSLFSSLYKKEPYDDSLGLHSLNLRLASKIGIESEFDYMVTMMHHNTHWFDDSSKKIIEKKLFSNNSLILTGHEHQQRAQHIENDNSFGISMAGKYEDGDLTINMIFIDTDNMTYVIERFEWNNILNIFKKIDNNLKCKTLVKQSHGLLVYNKDFLNNIHLDKYFQISNNIFDYFSFPTLKWNNFNSQNEQNQIIENYEDFVKAIENKNVISIIGDSISGKSTLLKYLYKETNKNSIALFFDAENFSNQTIEKVVKNAFEEQIIHNNGEYDQFLQMKKEKKVAYIDNFNVLKEYTKSRIMKGFLSIFDTIIITSINKDPKDVKEMLLDIVDSDKHLNLVIERLYFDKRLELIEKITNCLAAELQIIQVKELSEKINSIISLNLDMASLYPYFVILFTKHLLEKKDNIDAKESTFGFVFQNNLENNIKQHFTIIPPDQALIVFSKIAYQIHFSKKYPISFRELIEIIDQYKKEYRQIKLDEQTFIENALSSRIIEKHNGNGFVFSSKSYLAYFVAREIIEKNNEKMELGAENKFDDLKQVTNEICFSINSQILLFISYLTLDNRYMMHIVNEAQEYAESWVLLNLDKPNIGYLEKNDDGENDEYDEPTKEEKEKQNKSISRVERQVIENDLMIIDNMYDYSSEDLDKFANKIIKIEKLLDIVSKILPKFVFRIKSNAQDKIVDLIYDLPNKLVYALFKPIDENVDDFLNEIVRDFHERGKTDITRKQVLKSLKQLTLHAILSFYYRTIFSSYDEHTKDAILSHRGSGLVNRIQKLFIYEISDNSKDMKILSDQMINVYEYKSDSGINKTMLKIILRHHRSRIDGLISHGNVQKIKDKLYPKQAKKYLLEKPNSTQKKFKK